MRVRIVASPPLRSRSWLWLQIIAISLILCGLAICLAGLRTAFQADAGQSDARQQWLAQREARQLQQVIRLSVPARGVERYVLEGASGSNLALGPARVAYTGNLGAGNCVIAGHRDTHFRFLKDIRQGERIVVERGGIRANYRVRSIVITTPNDVRWMDDTAKPVLTLITCYPFTYVGNAPKRYVIRADLVEGEPNQTD